MIINLGVDKKLEVKERLVKDGTLALKDVASYVKKGQPMKPQKKLGTDGKPLGITIHNTNTVNTPTTMSEQYTKATHNQNMGGAMVHYYVDEVEAWQLLRDDEQGWHAGDGVSRKWTTTRNKVIGGNLDTIGIECIGVKSWDKAIILTAYLCMKHNLDPHLDIYTHQFFSGKQCPIYFLPDMGKFKFQVKTLIENAKKYSLELEKQKLNKSYEFCKTNGLVINEKPTAFVTNQELWDMLYKALNK